MSSLKEMMDQFVADGVLTRDEHDEFIETVHADGKIDDDERAQISRMFQLIREGKLKVVDSERDRFEAIKRKEALEKALANHGQAPTPPEPTSK